MQSVIRFSAYIILQSVLSIYLFSDIYSKWADSAFTCAYKPWYWCCRHASANMKTSTPQCADHPDRLELILVYLSLL